MRIFGSKTSKAEPTLGEIARKRDINIVLVRELGVVGEPLDEQPGYVRTSTEALLGRMARAGLFNERKSIGISVHLTPLAAACVKESPFTTLNRPDQYELGAILMLQALTQAEVAVEESIVTTEKSLIVEGLAEILKEKPELTQHLQIGAICGLDASQVGLNNSQLAVVGAVVYDRATESWNPLA